MPNLIETVKRAAIEAVEAAKPCTVLFGKVISTEPVKINIEQKITLTESQIILTKSIENNINIGDKVVLLRMQGGQKYIVLDKVII